MATGTTRSQRHDVAIYSAAGPKAISVNVALKGGDVATITMEEPGRPEREHPPEGTIRSLIPARLDRLGWSAVPYPAGHRPRCGLGARRPRDHDRQQRRRPDQPEAGAEPLLLRSGVRRRHRLPPRRGGRGPVLRPDVGQVRPPQPVHDHPRRVPVRRRAHRAHLRALAGLGLLGLGLPVHRRHGHRWRVRGHQLGHRRADPCQVPGSGGHRRERDLLGRCAHRAPCSPSSS